MLRLSLSLIIAAGCSALAAARSEPQMMHAVVAHAYGGPEVLKYETIARPEPKDDQVFIRVIAAAINPVDAAVRRGAFKDVSGEKFPLIPGYDLSGIVEKTGTNARKFMVGDAVYAFLSLKHGGGYAEYAIADENEASLKPKSINFEQAAAVPLAASTAWQALIDTAHLQPGQTVLVHGGSGGVGSFAIQIAKAHGAKVIATASTANQDLLAHLGADQSVDYKTTKFEEVVKEVDLVLDAVGGDTLKRSYDVVKKGGMIVSVAGRPDPAELEKREIRGTWILVQPKASVLEELTKLIEAKKITPIVSAIVPLADAAKAQEQVAARHTRGKIVLRIADEPKN
jgi:NADPH:quinone reductase-like Zn-dependent oxidoreductase